MLGALPALASIIHYNITPYPELYGAMYGWAGLWLSSIFLTLLIRALRGPKDTRSTPDIRRQKALKLRPFTPQSFFQTNKGLFLGLEEGKRPHYVSWQRFRSTHTEIMGTTGSGKGVAAMMILAQCAREGETVIIFDPKDDEFAPRVMTQAAADAGVPFYFLDLRPDAPPQFNLFRGTTAHHIEELLNTGFGYADKGTDADFYRLEDRRAVRATAAAFGGTDASVRRLASFVAASESTEKAAKFRSDMDDLASLPAIQTSKGLDIAQLMGEPGVLYIIGSIRHERTIRLQKMLLLRILQLIEGRDRTGDINHIALMLDEFKYLLSPPALQALGTVRDRKCHVLLAHQSLGDLNDCPGLEPQAVRGAVLENTTVKLIYRANSPETAKWAADFSGTITERALSESSGNGLVSKITTTLSEREMAHIHVNDLLTLPQNVGVLFGSGIARRVQVAPLPVGATPSVQPAQTTDIQKKAAAAAPGSEAR